MVLLLVHFETGDASARYWLEPRVVDQLRAYNLGSLIRTLSRVQRENPDLDYGGITDRAMDLLYGMSGWGYLHEQCGAMVNKIEEVFV